jgi:hypothetical protein
MGSWLYLQKSWRLLCVSRMQALRFDGTNKCAQRTAPLGTWSALFYPQRWQRRMWARCSHPRQFSSIDLPYVLAIYSLGIFHVYLIIARYGSPSTSSPRYRAGAIMLFDVATGLRSATLLPRGVDSGLNRFMSVSMAEPFCILSLKVQINTPYSKTLGQNLGPSPSLAPMSL